LEYTTDPELIHERYENSVFMVVDGGNGDIIPSTVVDLTGSEAIVLRQGKGWLE
jgi:tRNA A37 threonylcarbamoyladenosine synthetase subunit TsaC/SUA5/YrdC